MKTFEYPMEAITLNKKQWDFIMSPVMMATLPRAGIVRTFPRDMVYAPARCDVFAEYDIFYENYKRASIRHDV
jgi:hypothetical protein